MAFKKVAKAAAVAEPVKKVAAKSAPQVEAKAKATTEETVKSGKNLGRTTGLRIGVYQNATMDAQPRKKLTDEELGADWAAEFPDARCQFAERMDIVRAVRKLFNAGKHMNDAPATPVLKYELHNGRRVSVEETPGKRGRKTATSVAA